MKLWKTVMSLAITVGIYAGIMVSPVYAQNVDGSKDNVIDLPQGVTLVRNIPYGRNPEQKMDFYLPEKGILRAPVIFMVHGGGWRNGDKATQRVYENKVARWVPKGFIFVSIDYPMLPDSNVYAQEANVQLALATAQKLSDKFGGNPSKFIVMGHSAGGHLVSLMAADPEKAYANGVKPWLGTISLDAPLDIVATMTSPHPQLFDDAFGTDPIVWKSLSPSRQLTKSALPWFGVCSSRGEITCDQNRNYVLKSKLFGNQASFIKEDLSHREINETLGLPGLYTRSVEIFMASLDKGVAALLSRR